MLHEEVTLVQKSYDHSSLSPTLLIFSWYCIILQSTISVLYCTCSRAVGLTQVTGWRHWRHHQVERYGNIHGGQVTGAGPNHPDLIVSLKVHVGRTSCWNTMCSTRFISVFYQENKTRQVYFWWNIMQSITKQVWHLFIILSKSEEINDFSINTSIAAVIGGARDEGLTGIVHRSAHKTSPLENTGKLTFFLFIFF